jgi:hypothetical protein
MAVAGYILRYRNITDGGPNVDIDAGNVLTEPIPGVTLGKTYGLRVAAYDNAVPPNQSAFSAEVEVVVPASATSLWEPPVPTNWAEDAVTKNRSGTADSFASVTHVVLPKFNDVGDYLEMQAISGAANIAWMTLSDGAKTATIDPGGNVASTDNATQFLAGYTNGNVVRFTKTGATSYKYQVDGGADQVITQALTGEVELSVTINTTLAAELANPVSNIT